MPNTGHILDAKTLALWRLDDAQGAPAVDQVGKYSLAPTNGSPTQTAKLIFDAGLAKRFNGPYFNANGDAAMLAALLGEFTIEAAISPDTIGTDSRVMEVSSSTDRLLGFTLDVSGHLQGYWYTSGAQQLLTSTKILSATKSYHVAMRKSKDSGGLYRIDLFINGIKDSTLGALPNSTGTGTPGVFLGAGASGGIPFTGVVDDFRISSAARTDAEILDSWNRCFNNAALAATSKPVYTFAGARGIYMSLIKPIRDADHDQGRDLLLRLLGKMEVQADATRARIASLASNRQAALVPASQLAYLKDIVGFTTPLNKITSRLSVANLRKLVAGGISLWKRRGTPNSLIDMLRILTGRSVTYWDWFHFRLVEDEALLGEEQLGLDAFAIGGAATTQDDLISHIRLMDPGGTDAQLLLDATNLCRPISERIEIALLDFWDTFDDGARTRWTNIAGAPATVTAGKTLKLPATAQEQPNITTKLPFDYTNYNEYMFGCKFMATTAGTLRLISFIDGLGSIAFNISVTAANTGSVTATRTGRGGGANTTAPTVFTMAMNTFYTARAYLRKVPGAEQVEARFYIDGNLVLSFTYDFTGIAETAPRGGPWQVLTPDTGVYEIDNAETWRMPMRFATVGPTGYTSTSNFLTG